MVDFTKPLQTRDGREVKLIGTDLTREQVQVLVPSAVVELLDDEVPQTVVAIITGQDGSLTAEAFGPDGYYYHDLGDGTDESDHDLVNVPETIVTYRTFKAEGAASHVSKSSVGYYRAKTVGEVRTLLAGGDWDGYITVTTRDGVTQSVEFTPA